MTSWRHSLVTRLLVTSVVIAIAAISATAWLATRTATRAIEGEQGRSLSDDTRVYDLVVAYAAGHSDWSGAPALIAGHGRRITLMTEDRVVIADSGPGPSLARARPSAVVDPLDLDLGLTGGTQRIDPRAVGPYRLPAAERAELRARAEAAAKCLDSRGRAAAVAYSPSGRPVLASDDLACVSPLTEHPTATERSALTVLGRLISACVGMNVMPGFEAYGTTPPSAVPVVAVDKIAAELGTGTDRVRACTERARRTQLRPYVAPPALLFVTDPATGGGTTFTLSRANTIRIVAVTAAVLLATVLVTVLAGRRLVRPLRLLAEGADRQEPVPVTGRDEIGHLARALNDATSRRDRAEAQRRAMVGDVAHELRSPLTGIRSWIEAAQDGLTPADDKLLALLHEEAMLLQHVVDDLGDLAAADAGTLRVHPEPIDVRSLVAQVVDAHGGHAASAGVRLGGDVEGSPTVLADPVRLRQVIGNLVANAIRYTPPGGSVTVSASSGTIGVTDTGIGIGASDLPRVFDRFWRADASRSRDTGGSGLGLAIARQLVEAHAGTLTATSAPGRGTTFTIRLP